MYSLPANTPVLEPRSAGSGFLPTLTPASGPWTVGFAPTSDQSWLTITSTNTGSVSFSFTANPG